MHGFSSVSCWLVHGLSRCTVPRPWNLLTRCSRKAEATCRTLLSFELCIVVLSVLREECFFPRLSGVHLVELLHLLSSGVPRPAFWRQPRTVRARFLTIVSLTSSIFGTPRCASAFLDTCRRGIQHTALTRPSPQGPREERPELRPWRRPRAGSRPA